MNNQTKSIKELRQERGYTKTRSGIIKTRKGYSFVEYWREKQPNIYENYHIEKIK